MRSYLYEQTKQYQILRWNTTKTWRSRNHPLTLLLLVMECQFFPGSPPLTLNNREKNIDADGDGHDDTHHGTTAMMTDDADAVDLFWTPPNSPRAQPPPQDVGFNQRHSQHDDNVDEDDHYAFQRYYWEEK